MKKQKLLKITFICFISFILCSASAQQATLSSGGNNTGTGGTVSYSIGQVSYSNVNGTNGSVNQGVQQPFEIFTLGKDDFPEIQLLMTVYPNPTKSSINLNIQNYSFENLNYQLFDLNGRQIQSQKISNKDTHISMENLASAIYLLNVTAHHKILKTFKIIKNN